MKQIVTLISLLAALGFSLTISGYNNCYVATDVGFNNMNGSTLELHIDSALSIANDSILYRNIFKDGYIAHTDWDGGMNFFTRNDSVIWVDTTTFVGFIYSNELKIKDFGFQNTSISYTVDSIIAVDTTGKSIDNKTMTKNLFISDSLYRYNYYFYNNSYISDDKCVSLENECDCGSDVYKFYSGFYELVKNGVPIERYYTSGQIDPTRVRSVSRANRSRNAITLYKVNGVKQKEQKSQILFGK